MLFFGGKMIIEVNKYSLNPRWFVAGTKGSFGNEKLEFAFSKEWEGLSKKVTFIPFGGEEISVYYFEPIDIPYEVMVRAGTCVFGVSGYRGGVKILSVTGELKVLDTVASPDNSEYVPTPDEMTQVLNIATEAFDTAQEAKSIASEAKDGGAEAIETATALLGVATEVSNEIREKYGVMCEQYESTHAEYLDILEIKEKVNKATEQVESASSAIIGAAETAEQKLAETKAARDEVILAKDQTVAALEKTKDECRQIFSNALIGKEQGRAILIEDGAPYPQNLNVTISGNSRQEGEPSLDSPSQILSPSDFTFEKLSRNFIASPFLSGNSKINGVSFTKTGDGGVVMNGTIGSEIAVPYIFYNTNKKPLVILRKGVTYKLTCFNGNNITIRLCGTSYATILDTSLTVHSNLITPSKDIPIYKVLGYFISSRVGKELVDEKIYPMLEIVGENNEFEEYTSQRVQVPLELYGKDEWKDELLVKGDEGKVVCKNRYASYRFTGEEEWTVQENSNDTTLAYTDVPTPINESYTSLEYQLCNKLPVKDVTDTEEEGIFVSPVPNPDGTSRIYARLSVSGATAADFNSAFSLGDQIIYPTNEQENDCTDSDWGSALLDMITTSSGAFTLDCDGDMTVKYVKDINKEIEKIYRAVISVGAAL